MAKQIVLVEVFRSEQQAFAKFSATSESTREAEFQIESLAGALPGEGVDIDPGFAPVPMFSAPSEGLRPDLLKSFGAFSIRGDAQERPAPSDDHASTSYVVKAEVDVRGLRRLRDRADVRIYPSSRLHMIDTCACGRHDTRHRDTAGETGGHVAPASDLGHSAGGLDCRPFRPGVSVETIRERLGVETVWRDGFRGQNIVVAIVDEGIDAKVYPVIGGYQGPDAPAPGSALVTSHGSMCAADVLVAAPWAKLYDYPLIADATSADGVQMYQQILSQRRKDGTPQVASNSYGYYGLPSQADMPNHEAWDVDHPFHRKVREIVASGAAVFFAAGNCGSDCPSGRCQPSATGPNCSINSSAALGETFAIAAVNSFNERIGYSAQGPSLNAPGFVQQKPDLSCYSHFFANFGPGRPGGIGQPFDNGTSAACPTAAGVAALLLSRFSGLTVPDLRRALLAGAVEIGMPGWDGMTGHGVINAAASYSRMLRPQ